MSRTEVEHSKQNGPCQSDRKPTQLSAIQRRPFLVHQADCQQGNAYAEAKPQALGLLKNKSK